MNPLLNSTPHQDLRDWRELDRRVRAFRDNRWDTLEGFEPFWKFIKLELILFSFMTFIIFGFSFYVSKQNEKEMDRYLKEWHNRKILKK